MKNNIHASRSDKMLLKGYGAASTALGAGVKPNGEYITAEMIIMFFL